MKVWVRVSACMDIDSDLDSYTATHVEIKAGLNLTVYPTRDRAKAAQMRSGGIILEVDATSLADVENEFGKEVLLTAETSDDGKQPSTACISVCYDGLPWKSVPNYGPYDPGTVEPQGEIAEFGPEAKAWLNDLEEHTGFELHQ